MVNQKIEVENTHYLTFFTGVVHIRLLTQKQLDDFAASSGACLGQGRLTVSILSIDIGPVLKQKPDHSKRPLCQFTGQVKWCLAFAVYRIGINLASVSGFIS